MNEAATASTTALAANARLEAPDLAGVGAGVVAVGVLIVAPPVLELEPLGESREPLPPSIVVSLPDLLPLEVAFVLAGAGVVEFVAVVGALVVGAGVEPGAAVVGDGLEPAGAVVVVAGAGVDAGVALAQYDSIGLMKSDSRATFAMTQSPTLSALSVASAARHALLPQSFGSTSALAGVGGLKPVSVRHCTTLGSDRSGKSWAESQSAALATASEAAASTKKDFIVSGAGRGGMRDGERIWE